jgi:DNA-binding XRE family transcriptional regulator
MGNCLRLADGDFCRDERRPCLAFDCQRVLISMDFRTGFKQVKVIVTGMRSRTNQPRTAFGERIAAAREALGLTKVQLAAKVGVSARCLIWWERHPVALKPEQFVALSVALGVSADVLLGLRAPVGGEACVEAVLPSQKVHVA